MKRSRFLAILVGGVLAATTLGAATAEPNEPNWVSGPGSFAIVEADDKGFTIALTDEGEQEVLDAGVMTAADVAAASGSLCEGTYTLRKDGSRILEWGTQFTCSPSLPVSQAPLQLRVQLQQTCNGPLCIAWTTKKSANSAWSYSRVTTVSRDSTCSSTADDNPYRIRVEVWVKGGALHQGTAYSGRWNDIACDFT